MSCPCCVRNLNPLGILGFPSNPLQKRRPFHTNKLRHHIAAVPESSRPSISSPAEPEVIRPEPSLPSEPSSSPRLDLFSIDQDADKMKKQSSSELTLKQRAHHMLELINDATKWWVSGAAFFVLVTRHDEYVAWALTGSIVAAFNNKLLKKLINQARPAAARKVDPGMPSSHAQSLAFLTTYAIIGVNALQIEPFALSLVPCTAIAMLGLFLAWLRVRLGFHTADQVAVGVAVGVVSASLWYWLGIEYAFPYMFMNEDAVMYLWAITGLAIVIFAGKTVLGWFAEKKLRKQMEDGAKKTE